MSDKPQRAHHLAAFGEILAHLWKEQQAAHPRLSQRAFARMAHLNHSQLSKWNKGRVHNPNVSDIERLEAAYGYPGRLAEIVRRNQANPSLAFLEALEILKGGTDGGQSQNPNHPPTPAASPTPRVDPPFVDRRTARKILKTADALAALIRRAFGEQPSGARPHQAERRDGHSPRRAKTSRTASAGNHTVVRRKGA